MRNEIKNEEMEKVEETVIWGSVYEAIYSGFITCNDILDYLKGRKSKNEKEEKKLCVAFRIVCLLEKEANKKKFKSFILSTENANFSYIYSFTNKQTSTEICKKIHSFPPPKDMNFIKAICDEIFHFNKENAEYSCGVRNLKHTSLYTFNDILRSDFLTLFDGKEGKHYYKNVIARCIVLAENASLYWEHVGEPLYRNFILKTFPNPIFKKMELQILSDCFSSLYDEKVMNRPEILHHLSTTSRQEAAYHLGFPIHEYIPSAKKIEQALNLLGEIGVQKYLQSLAKSPVGGENISVSNTENVHCDNIDDFNSFDVVHYYTDDDNTDTKHLFRFTRPEFATILKDKKNFYTGELLPDFILSEIRCRLQIASTYNLPPAKILSELLNTGEEDGECEDVDDVDDVDDENLENEDVEDEDEMDLDENDGEDMDLDESDEAQYYICNVQDRNGKVSPARVQMSEELQNLDPDEFEEFLVEMFSRENLKYLGPVSCDCDTCGVSLNDRVRS